MSSFEIAALLELPNVSPINSLLIIINHELLINGEYIIIINIIMER